MVANKAERAGSFVVPKGEPADVALLDAFIKSSLESHLTGRPVAPWLSEGDPMMLAMPSAVGEAAAGRGSRDSAAADDELGGQSQKTGSLKARKEAKARRGIVIPAPAMLDGEWPGHVDKRVGRGVHCMEEGGATTLFWCGAMDSLEGMFPSGVCGSGSLLGLVDGDRALSSSTIHQVFLHACRREGLACPPPTAGRALRRGAHFPFGKRARILGP